MHTEAYFEVETTDFGKFADEISLSLLPLRVSRQHRGSFWSHMTSARVNDGVFSEISAADHSVTREISEQPYAPRHAYKLSYLMTGSGLIAQDQRETRLLPGSLVLYDTARPYQLEFSEDVRSLVFMIPAQQFDVPATMLRGITAVSLSERGGISDILLPYLHSFAGRIGLFGQMGGQRLANGLIHSLSGLISEHLGVRPRALDSHAVLLEEIEAYIEHRLSEADLTPSRIAGAHHISVRHLHAIFNRDDRTVAAWIRDRRLQSCHADLTSAKYAGLPVASIASRWCFTDPAHFTKLFKATYGVTPGALRRSALAGDNGAACSNAVPVLT